MIRRSLFLFFLVLLVPCVLRAENGAEKLQKIQTEVERQKQQSVALDEKARQTSGDIENLRQKLIDSTRALQSKQKEQDNLEDRLSELESETKVKSAALDSSKKQLGMLTGILIRLGEEPPASYFLRTGMTDAHIRRAILLRAILPRLRDEAETAAHDLAELATVRRQAAEQRRAVVAARESLEEQRQGLDRLIAARQGMLKRTEAEKAAIARQLVSLTNEAKDMRQLFQKVAPGAPSSRAGALNPGLVTPVTGVVSRGFGARDKDGVESHGLTYRAAGGSPVVAPLGGRVVFAGPFRGYGQILILQHKGGYHSLLAGFGRIDAEMGQEVEAGEPLGALPSDAASRPELYFEWRRNGEPVDPMVGNARGKSEIAAKSPGHP